MRDLGKDVPRAGARHDEAGDGSGDGGGVEHWTRLYCFVASWLVRRAGRRTCVQIHTAFQRGGGSALSRTVALRLLLAGHYRVPFVPCSLTPGGADAFNNMRLPASHLRRIVPWISTSLARSRIIEGTPICVPCFSVFIFTKLVHFFFVARRCSRNLRRRSGVCAEGRGVLSSPMSLSSPPSSAIISVMMSPSAVTVCARRRA
jgi:hypothetical protein